MNSTRRPLPLPPTATARSAGRPLIVGALVLLGLSVVGAAALLAIGLPRDRSRAEPGQAAAPVEEAARSATARNTSGSAALPDRALSTTAPGDSPAPPSPLAPFGRLAPAPPALAPRPATDDDDRPAPPAAPAVRDAPRAPPGLTGTLRPHD